MREIDRRTFLGLCLGTAGAVVTRSWLLKDQQKATSSYTDPDLTTTPPPDQTPTLIPDTPTPTPTVKQFAQVAQTTDSEEEIKALRREHISSRSPRPTETPTIASPEYVPTNDVWEGPSTYYYEEGCVGCSLDLRMANGEPLDGNALTLAFNRAPLGSKVEVTNLKNNLSAIAEVTDRGGFERHGFIADLTRGLKNAVKGEDITPVRIRLLRASK